MSARLRHERRTRDLSVIHIHLEAGAPADRVRVSANELKRFCWAVLADLDPIAADQAATDDGKTLAALIYGAFEPTNGKKPIIALPRVGTKKRRILETLAGGHYTTDALRQFVPDAAAPESLLFEMRTSGFVERVDKGTHGPVALWGLTETAKQQLGPVLAEAARAA